MSGTGQGQEDAVDLRRVARLAFANWRWIAASTLAAAAAAFGWGMLTTETFEATALVVVCKPEETPCGEGLVALARSDGIMAAVRDREVLVTIAGEPVPVDLLANQLRTYVVDPFLVLTAQGGDPAKTAAIVNSWAHVLVERVLEDYRVVQESKVAIDTLAAEAWERWRAAEMGRSSSESWFALEALRARRQALLTSLNQYAERRAELDKVLEEAEGIRGRLDSGRLDEQDEAGLKAAVIVLGVRALGSQDVSAVCGPGSADEGELSVGGANLRPGGEISGGDWTEILHCIEAVARDDREFAVQAEARIAAELQSLRPELAQLEAEGARLDLEVEAAADSVLFTGRSARERELSFLEGQEVARVVSEASPPTQPIRPRPGRDVPLAGAVGFFLALGWIFVRDWWKAGAP